MKITICSNCGSVVLFNRKKKWTKHFLKGKYGCVDAVYKILGFKKDKLGNLEPI